MVDEVYPPGDSPITLETLQAAFTESLLPPQPPTYAFHPDVQKDDHPLHELYTSMFNNAAYNCAPATGTTPMDPVAPLTIDALLAMYHQIEEIAQSIETHRLYLRDNLHVFIGAPWEVIRAASLLAHNNPLDIHPEEYKRAQHLVLSYLEDKSNASLEEQI
jgi:hypothetical protein